jgi:hypothetical protein
MIAGVMFRPISFKILLGLKAQYPYGPYCTLKHIHNPKIGKVRGITFRLMIKSGNRPIAFFSRKLSVTQARYSVTKIELLAIVETLKEFKGMLWGQQIKVYTDHKNLTRDGLGLTSDRVY